MIDNRLAEDIQMKLRPDHFFEPLHARIYEQILKLIDRNMIASPVTLRPLFEADEEMKELGGPAYLAQLTGSAPRSSARATSPSRSTSWRCSAR
jgi:replicative DNA helicase